MVTLHELSNHFPWFSARTGILFRSGRNMLAGSVCGQFQRFPGGNSDHPLIFTAHANLEPSLG